jgi:hypothetical protein
MNVDAVAAYLKLLFHVPGKNEEYHEMVMSRDSSVGVATGYEMDGRGWNPGSGKIFLFSTTSRPGLRPTQPPIQCVPGAISPVVMRSGREADD